METLSRSSLGEFRREQMGAATAWNCSTLAADWCVTLGHPDFAFEWRSVTGEAECAAVGPGQLLPHWQVGIGDALPVIDDLREGDIAVVTALGHEAGAIFTGGKWALRGTRGLHFLAPGQVRVSQAWRPTS